MNTFDTNDPRVTAYALGELNAQESAEIEAIIAANASLRAEVDAIRQTAGMLRTGFASEPSPGLTDAQRLSVQHTPRQAVQSPLRFRGRSIWIGSGLAAAACLTLAVLITWNQSVRDRNNHVAIEAGVSTLNEPLSSTLADRDLREQAKDEAQLRARLTQPDKQEGAAGGGGGGGDGVGGCRGEINLGMPLNPSDPLAASSPSGIWSMRVEEDHSAREVPLPAAGQGAFVGSTTSSAAPGGDTTPISVTGGTYPSTASAAPSSSPPPPPSAAPGAPSPRPSSPAAGYAGNEPGRMAGAPLVAGEGIVGGRALDAAETRQDLNGAVRYGIPNEELHRNKSTSGENYAFFIENEFLKPTDAPLSTYSVDVDTASFANARRFLNSGQLPPKDSVRIEEFINYFPYTYEAPSGETPFSANIEVNQAPWKPEHRLVRIGLRGKDIKMDMRPATSIVFLIDVSGSMNQPAKLPLVKQSLLMLLDQLNGDDRLAIVTYAGNAGLVMDSTFCSHEKKPEIAAIINGLSAGGSTNGAGGISVAYETAVKNHIKGGVNRVILCTDGDFNVGVSSEAELIRLIEDKRSTGVYLSVLGFGTGNIQDAKMKGLSIHGNGNYGYIDSVEEGKKVLVDQLAGTLVTIAKDVKFQVEFNPAKVGAYRLIGYEQRVMAAQDFNNDLKDAGEIGAGHTVTALYEIIPPGDALAKAMPPQVDDLKYQKTGTPEAEIMPSDELLTIKVRYKEPDGTESKLLEFPVKDSGAELNDASPNFKFASSVAAFGMILRESAHKGNATLDKVMGWWESSLGPNTPQQWHELSGLIQTAKRLQPSAAGKQPAQPQ